MSEMIDLFAGCGGLSLGLKWAGFRPGVAVESDKWAAETFARNFPETRVVCDDIRNLGEKGIRRLYPHSPTLICGGPPCQGFSHSNVLNRDAKDPRNSLFRDFLTWVDVLRPQVALIENVRGLLSARTVAGDSVIQLIEQEIESIGYKCESRVLDAQRYGVPQRRERVFILAVPETSGLKPSALFPEATHARPNSDAPDLFRNAQQPVLSLWDAISDLPQQEWREYDSSTSYSNSPTNEYQAKMRQGSAQVIHNHEPMRHTARIVERFKRISIGQSEQDSPEEYSPMRRGAPGSRSTKRYDQNSRRQHPDVPCNTIVASSHTNYIHPFLQRNFTVREMMRIQSFPDSFILCGKRAVLSRKLSEKKGLTHEMYLDQRMQVGNAVPPLLASAIGRQIARNLLKSEEA